MQDDALPKVYLAGPDIFCMDWPNMARSSIDLCLQYGLQALLPIPPELPSGPGVTEPGSRDLSAQIFGNCCTLLRQSQAVIANLTPYLGSEPDSGTVIECALAYSWGIPVFGYSNEPNHEKSLHVNQTEDGRNLCHNGRTWVWRENFGLSHNLMVHGVCCDIVNSLESALQLASNHLNPHLIA